MDATGQEQAGRGGGSGTSQDGAGSDAESALDDTTVFDPERAAAAEGDEVRLQGQADPDQPEVEAGRATGPGLRNDGIVPYRDVLGEYADRATRTVQQPGYPVGRRDTVTSYFDRLAQPATP